MTRREAVGPGPSLAGYWVAWVASRRAAQGWLGEAPTALGSITRTNGISLPMGEGPGEEPCHSLLTISLQTEPTALPIPIAGVSWHLWGKPRDQLARQRLPVHICPASIYFWGCRQHKCHWCRGEHLCSSELCRLSVAPGPFVWSSSPRSHCQCERMPLRFCVTSSLVCLVSRDLLSVAAALWG